MDDGSLLEVAMVGNEGIVGISLFMGGETTVSQAIVQSVGYGYQLSGKALKSGVVQEKPNCLKFAVDVIPAAGDGSCDLTLFVSPPAERNKVWVGRVGGRWWPLYLAIRCFGQKVRHRRIGLQRYGLRSLLFPAARAPLMWCSSLAQRLMRV